MFNRIFSHLNLAIAAFAILATAVFGLTGSASAAGAYAGYVYTETNSASGNSVLVFGRGENGSLTALTPISTNGTGTGSGLGTQGALALSENGKWLLAVNAGSNDISVISTASDVVTSRVSSGGTMPTSVTLYKNWVYVLNHGSDSISGLSLGSGGTLTPIPNSTLPLSGSNVDAKQVQFSPDGKVLVVTEKATNKIDLFTVGANGVAAGPFTYGSFGTAPFGFDFGKHNTLIVSEAASNAASSYHVTDNGSLGLITPSASNNGQLAPCWVVVTNDGRFAYTANAHIGTITGYAVNANGSLVRLTVSGVSATTGGAPLDETITKNDQFLYVLNPSSGLINGFGIKSDGSLVSLASSSGIPTSASGLVAR